MPTRNGQDILNTMMDIHPELQAQAGGADVARALRCANIAQYHFETLLALQADLLGDATGTVTTATNTETTAFPSGVLRLDRLQLIDSTTNRPSYDLRDIKRTGGHIMTPGWPWNIMSFISSTSGGGKPVAYYTNGTSIYWVPLPDATYTIRWYGFQKAADLTAGGSFAYQDNCLLPIATFAVKLVRTGLDDALDNYNGLAQEIYGPVIKLLGNFKRESAPGLNYSGIHTT